MDSCPACREKRSHDLADWEYHRAGPCVWTHPSIIPPTPAHSLREQSAHEIIDQGIQPIKVNLNADRS